MRRLLILAALSLAALLTVSAQQVSGTLTYDVPISGTLSASVPRLVYDLNVGDGDVVTLTLRAPTFDAYLLLRDASGAVLAENNNGGGGTDARIRTFTFSQGGRYFVEVTSASGSESGDFTLTAQKARFADGGDITYNEIVIGRLSGQDVGRYTFSGRAGDSVVIELTSGDFDPLVRLLSQGNVQIAFNDDAAGLDSRISGVILPQDGTYTIIVDGYRGISGQRKLEGMFVLALESEDAAPPAVARQQQPAQATPTQSAVVQPANPTVPPPQGEAITYGQTVDGQLTEQTQQGVVYTFEGMQGDVVSLSVQSSAFDALVRVIAPDGLELAFDDDSGGDLNPLINGLTLPASGTYAVIVDGYRGVNGDRVLIGAFTLRLVQGTDITAMQAAPTLTPTATVPQATPTPLPTIQLTPTPLATMRPSPTPFPTAMAGAESGSIAYGQTVQGSVSEADRTVSYTFEGRAGQVISIRLESLDFDPLVRLVSPDGTELTYDDDSGGALQAEIRNFELPIDGTYKIVVDTYLNLLDVATDGNFTLTLSLSGADVAQATPSPTSTVTPQPTQPMAASSLPERYAVALRSAEPLGYGDSRVLTFSGAPDEAFAFRFNALRDDIVTVRATSNDGLDTALYLVASDGATPLYDDDSGAGFDPEIRRAVMPAGQQVVLLMPIVPGSRGTVTLELVLESPIELSQPRIVRLTDKEPRQVFRVTGSAGEQLRLSIVSQSEVSGTPTVTVYQGTTVIAQNMVGRNLRLAFDFALVTNEPVQIVVEQETGRGFYAVFEMAIERVP